MNLPFNNSVGDDNLQGQKWKIHSFFQVIPNQHQLFKQPPFIGGYCSTNQKLPILWFFSAETQTLFLEQFEKGIFNQSKIISTTKTKTYLGMQRNLSLKFLILRCSQFYSLKIINLLSSI
jgi:hypothetical protein